MPIQPQDVEALLRARFPHAEIHVEGEDGIHLAATVVDDSFRGMTRVQQQRAVYAALKDKLAGSDAELHALQLTTRARG